VLGTLEFLKCTDNFPNGFVSILDDDDEYLPNHLTDCVTAISENAVAVFQRLIWQNDDTSTMNVDLTKDQLTLKISLLEIRAYKAVICFSKRKTLLILADLTRPCQTQPTEI
jgi:hypothetical protein